MTGWAQPSQSAEARVTHRRRGPSGHGGRLERGPGRHGMGGGALFIDMLDQDGHRVELFNTHDQAIDLEPSRGSNLSDPRRADLWGFPARERWCVEVSRFAGVDPVQPALKASTRTVEEGQRLAARRSDREV